MSYKLKPLVLGCAAVAAMMSLVRCVTTENTASYNSDTSRLPAASPDRRGLPSEYDMGPPKNSKWPDIFAETPNYRAYGKALYQAAAQKAGLKDDGQEKFRWKVGPMWYRGRLSPNSVKVFVIGQEGAQDENVSNRTFTGSTGTKMQNFINYFGIDRSYLFMNTFIYTITGQYGELADPADSPAEKKQKEVRSKALFWLAQNPKSVVVQHRHRMFDYMLSQNKNTVKLIIGVGAAGKDSLATWIRSHGGQCTAKQLGSSFCDAGMIAPGARAVGVMHPGAASARNGGADAAGALQIQFGKRADLVAGWMKENPNWLKPDPGVTPLSGNFMFKDAPIPHRDFAFATNWRMGKSGTSTNRRGADGIQIFSDAGCYNNMQRINGKCDQTKTLNVQYEDVSDEGSVPKMVGEDMPWESPKSIKGRREYDIGPGAFSGVLTAWPDFSEQGITSHKSFGFNGVYRGNLSNPKVVILADQESNDDMFSARALTGSGGQKLQTLLNKMGLNNDYVIIRTLPVDSLDLPVNKVKEIASSKEVVKARNTILEKILAQGKTKLFMTVGPVAASLVPSTYNPAGIALVSLDSPNAASHVSQWQSAISKLSVSGINELEGRYNGELSAIPRGDLPAHTRWWMGTSGSRASRAFVGTGASRVVNGDYYQFNAPSWVSSKNYPANPQELSKENDPYKSAYNSSLSSFRENGGAQDTDESAPPNSDEK